MNYKIIVRAKLYQWIAIIALICGSVAVAEAGTVSYVYDAGGRLLAAFDGNGKVTNYQYDVADNITAMITGSANVEAVFGYSPDHATCNGTCPNITIFGNDFGSNVSVFFNGSNAIVVSSTPSQIVATLASNATTGAVTVSSSTGRATGPTFFVP